MVWVGCWAFPLVIRDMAIQESATVLVGWSEGSVQSPYRKLAGEDVLQTVS